MAGRDELLSLAYLVIALWTTASLYETEAALPVGYFIKSPFNNFFRAPSRAVNRTEARHITGNSTQCKCRAICFSVIGCQAWSLTTMDDNTLECRVTRKGPASGALVNDPNSIYYFFEDNICDFTSSTMNKELIYDLNIMEDVALKKPTSSSPAYMNIFPAYLGNDGDDTTWFASDSATNTWWSVDFLTSHTIFHVKILPRQNAEGVRFKNIQLYIGDTLPLAGDVSAHKYLGIYNGPYNSTTAWLVYACHGITGRVLTIKGKTSADFVDMMTVQAYAIKN